MKLMHGDCIELMNEIKDKSIDMILCDLPYGITKCEWDIPISLDSLWKQYKRIIKDNGAIVLFSAQPFTTDLIESNRKMFRYEIIWKKTTPSGFLNAKKMPMRIHENILVFYKKAPTYNPQMRKSEKHDTIGRTRYNSGNASQYNEFRKDNYEYTETGYRYPIDVIEFSNWNGISFGKKVGNNGTITKHPTQKPVDLLEWLIRTYTNEGEIVLDNCMGSGTTGIACMRTKRQFIGIELHKCYYDASLERIKKQKDILDKNYPFEVIGNIFDNPELLKEQ